jgi:hypothetical protein
MTHEIPLTIVLHLPSQAPPVMRMTISSAIHAESGIMACDNDHNTDTEHDIFFIDMS